ncbi:DUF3800 domain-containing protein [Kibdelosporangium lantanae]|uniref:DUF3800 domain-containing protein n=1 Tax=Kibdelosporangium lantanae TaxID=1497396 RepID=A0ABW3M645_9PSEU
MRLFYVDDSGAPATRTAVFGWVELDADAWYATLQHWLDWRSKLHETVGIPADHELRAIKFIGGRGYPTLDARRAERTEVLRSALVRMSAIPGLGFGAVYARGAATTNYHDLKTRCYHELVRFLDDRLARDGGFGMVVVRGDGTDESYYEAHRALSDDSRCLIEDPLFRSGRDSQWIQMADLVAYAAYMHVARIRGKEAIWSWYNDHLSSAVTGPVPLRVGAVEKS